ncbi:uncharacterized protein LOC131642444 [Vicia villosa]|uniref:uncharacterized protein LOC131642444 n=1 Tax=Vicia villosa TaxID=3911 RepID=UPI00273BBCC5|nr:uncharacterized protein LOC131642444 [Vicia villosa]
MAMVAKQGWFIMSQPQALVSRIFKARYFPRTSFFDAKLGFNPSYVWRSMWKATEVLTLGCRWSIGDGSKIKVMEEPWLRGIREGCLSGPQKQVPLVVEVKENRLLWKEEQNGCYTVRSRHRIWRNAKKISFNLNTNENWNNIWNIKAPARAKHLLWRICQGCLPTCKRLRQHHVQCTGACPFCGNNDENDWHVFFECHATYNCWIPAGFSNIIDHITHSFYDIKSLILDICSKENRNTAGKFAREWFSAQHIPNNNNVDQHSLLWIPSPSGWVKFNVNVDFNINRGTTNRGWCLRDEFGNFITAGVVWDPSNLLVLEEESLALKEAIQSVTLLNLDRIIFESDSLKVIQAFQSVSAGNSELYFIVSDIKLLLHNFSNFEVKFVNRQANMVAHSLVKAANSWARRNILHVIPL